MAKLYFRYGAMNCGKSTSLLQVAHNYEEVGLKAILIKPAIDTKGKDNIVSRLGCSQKVDILLKKSSKIDEKLMKFNSYRPFFDDFACILVDEAQFLTKKQADELYYVSKQFDIPVICYGLRCDFMMNGFEGSTRLLEIADSIEEMKTVCKCGRKATQNMRLVNNTPTFSGEQVMIDGEDDEITYQSVCGDCYIENMRAN